MTAKEGAYTPPPEVYQAGSTTYGKLFRESASLNSERTALIEGARSRSYAELNERSDRMARDFAATFFRSCPWSLPWRLKNLSASASKAVSADKF